MLDSENCSLKIIVSLQSSGRMRVKSIQSATRKKQVSPILIGDLGSINMRRETEEDNGLSPRDRNNSQLRPVLNKVYKA